MAVVKIREKAFFAVMAQSGLRPHTIKQLRMDEKFSLTMKMIVPMFPPEEKMEALRQLEASMIRDGIITREELDQRAKKIEGNLKTDAKTNKSSD